MSSSNQSSITASPTGNGEKGNKRIGKRLDAALRALVFDAMSTQQAADHVGMTKRGLLAALRKPHVKAHRRDIEQAMHAGLFAKSLKVGEELMDGAQSESVRLQAAQWVRTLTDPEAHRKGSDTAKSLIIRLEAGPVDGGRLLVDQAAGTVQAIENKGKSVIDV